MDFGDLTEGDDDPAVVALLRSLTNQPPQGEEIVRRFEMLREPAKTFGRFVLALCPPSRERSLAITNLEQALMWAVKSVALNQEALLQQGDLTP